MSKNRKRATTLAAAGAVVAIAIGGGVAYAAFVRNNDVATNASSENFDPFTVTGVMVGRSDGSGTALLPGESGKVKLQISKPSNTVNARISSITPVPVQTNAITGLADVGKAGTCQSKIKLATYSAPNIVLPKGSGYVEVTLNQAVTLDPSTNVECEGMTFPTNFTVSFQATRDAASSGNTFEREPSAAPAAPAAANPVDPAEAEKQKAKTSN